MNIRTLMLVVLYWAVALGLLVPALGAPAYQRPVLLGVAMLAIPLVLAGLSWLILRPGPRRAWLVRFFAWCAMLVMASLFAIAGFPNYSLEMYLLVGLNLAAVVVFAWQRLLPGECPACRKRGLLKATRSSSPRQLPLSAVAFLCESCGVVLFSRRAGVARACAICGKRIVPTNSHLSAHYVCGACGVVTYSSRGRMAQRCSRCDRSRWLDSPVPDRWEYYWCLACGTRSKQRVDGRWEEARRPRDDAVYARFDFVGWVKSLSRWSGSGPAS